MIDDKKQTVSVRMSASDHNKVKEIANRLHVRESDLFRFAVKSAITKLLPLYDKNFKGKDLIPLFIEFGHELTNYFELDTMRLDEIINEGVSKDSDNYVDYDDLNLIAMSGIRENHLYIRLNYLNQEFSNISNSGGSADHENHSLLKRYLYRKYVEDSRSNRKSTSEFVNEDHRVKHGMVANSY